MASSSRYLAAHASSSQSHHFKDSMSWRTSAGAAFGITGLVLAANCADFLASAEGEETTTAPPSPAPRVAEKPLTRRKLARRNSQRKQKRHYPYVIIGGGTSSYAAIEAIRQIQPDANILIISDEPSLPRADVDDESEFFQCASLFRVYNEYRRHISSRLESEPDAYSAKPITLLLGRRRLRIDSENRTVLLHDGTSVTYDKCLLASAGEPREFYVLNSNDIPFNLRDKINTLTKLQHFVDLDEALKDEEIEHLTVIGGGFLGTELVCSIADHVKDRMHVSHVMVESGALQRYIPEYLSRYLTQKMKVAGIQVVSDRLVTGLQNSNATTSPRSVSVEISGYESENLETDYVVLASTHVNPNTTIGEESGLEIDPKHGGVVVNGSFEYMNGLYVAGNLASYYDPAIGRRRVDRYDHALNSGLLAGQNMALTNQEDNKQQTIYRHQPAFKSEFHGLGITCEGVGIIDSNLKTVAVWLAERNEAGEIQERTPSSEFRRGIVYYVQNNEVVGILLWNASEQLQKARDVVNSKKNIRNVEELATTILLAPEEWTDIIQA